MVASQAGACVGDIVHERGALAAVGGGPAWKAAPSLPFYIPASIGVAGTAAFAVTVDEGHAG